MNDTTFTLTDSVKYFSFSFNLLDQFANVIHSSQLADFGSYNGTKLLDVTYSLTYETTTTQTIISENQPLPLMDDQGIVTLRQTEHLQVGQYTLKL